MNGRISTVGRADGFEILVDGVAVPVFPGETVATAMLAAERVAFRRDGQARARGLYCNMGTCCECLVGIARAGAASLRLRACLVDAAPGMVVTTASVSA